MSQAKGIQVSRCIKRKRVERLFLHFPLYLIIFLLATLKGFSSPEEQFVGIDEQTEIKDTAQYLTMLMEVGEENLQLSNWTVAIDSLDKAFIIAKQYSDTIILSDSHLLLGRLYRNFKKTDQAFYHFMEAKQLLKKYSVHNDVETERLLRCYFSLSTYYRSKDVLSKAQQYLDTCRRVSAAMSSERLEFFGMDVEQARIYYLQGKVSRARKMYLALLKDVEPKLKRKDISDDAKASITSVYSTLGEMYRVNANFEKSLDYYGKAIAASKKYTPNSNNIWYLLDKKAWVLAKLDNFPDAYKALRISKNGNDRSFNIRRNKNIEALELKSQFQAKIEKQHATLQEQNIELLEKEKTILRFQLCMIALFLLILISVLYYRQRHLKTKHHRETKKIMAEAQEKELESQEMIEFKNKELTSSTLRLLEQEKLLEKAKGYMESNAKGKEGQLLLQELKMTTQTDWDTFNQRFVSVNSNFYANLIKEYPTLSSSEQKLCALIKLNFSGKEMAHLLGISLNSVHMARYRLRSKMNLNRETNLSAHIAKF